MTEEKVILVDNNDNEVGIAEKIACHRQGRLHRAFSVFVFNSRGDTLLQKRSRTKYHSGGLWSNTCCSHPKPGESTAAAARRRLVEEMDVACELEKIFSLMYRTPVGNGLVEHEYDHVYVGRFDGRPNPCGEEVEDWRWMPMETLQKDLQENSHRYTYWLKILFGRVITATGINDLGGGSVVN